VSITTLLGRIGPLKGLKRHTRYSSYRPLNEGRDWDVRGRNRRLQNMPSSKSKERLEEVSYRVEPIECVRDMIAPDDDVLMEQILDNVNNTPLGKVLKRIASLPEVRRQKVLDLRRSLAVGDYELNSRLDIALDRVLEDLTGF